MRAGCVGNSRREDADEWLLCGLTFELSWHRRWDTRARLAKMYTVPPTGPAWPAVGAQLERGVRPHRAHMAAATAAMAMAEGTSKAWPSTVPANRLPTSQTMACRNLDSETVPSRTSSVMTDR